MAKQKDNSVDDARAKLLSLIQRLLEPSDQIIVNLIETKPLTYDDAKALAQQLGKHEPIFYYHEPGADGNIANGDLVIGVNAYDQVNAKRQAVRVRNGDVVVGTDTIGDNHHPFRGNGDGGNTLLWRDLASWVEPLGGTKPEYAESRPVTGGTLTPAIVGTGATLRQRPDYVPAGGYRVIVTDLSCTDVESAGTAATGNKKKGGRPKSVNEKLYRQMDREWRANRELASPLPLKEFCREKGWEPRTVENAQKWTKATDKRRQTRCTQTESTAH